MNGRQAELALAALAASASARGQQPVRTWKAVVRRALQYTAELRDPSVKAADLREAGDMTVREIIMLIAAEGERQ